MSTTQLDAEKIPDEVACLPIKLIRVTVHTLGYIFDDDDRSGNHASIYLAMEGKSSVHLNMREDEQTNAMGKYKVALCEYDISKSAVQNFDMKARSGLTVGEVTSLVISLGRYKYKLNRNGLGCRYWTQTIVKDLEASGYIDTASNPSSDDVLGYLEYNYHKDKYPEFTEIARGTFVN